MQGRAQPPRVNRVVGRMGRIRLRLGLGTLPFGEATAANPDLLDFPPAVADGRAPVELYVGTHPSMLRATRVLVYSLLAVRDPRRGYRVHLMSNLRGIDRRGWRHGWQEYAQAAASLAGPSGRALYADATCLIASDPAPLFDEARAGLVDLTRTRWPGIAQVAGPETWGSPRGLPVAGEGIAARWHALEAAADAQGYLLFTKRQPSGEFAVLIEQYRQMHEENYFPGQRLKHHVSAVRELVAGTGARTLLDYGSGKAEGYRRIEGEPADSPWRTIDAWPGVRVRCFDPGVPAFSQLPEEPCDGVISTDVVEHLAPFDVPWVLAEMFQHARRFVFVIASCMPAIKLLPDGRNAHTTIEPPDWWRDEMHLAASRHADLAWRLGCDVRTLLGKRTTLYAPRPAG